MREDEGKVREGDGKERERKGKGKGKERKGNGKGTEVLRIPSTLTSFIVIAFFVIGVPPLIFVTSLFPMKASTVFVDWMMAAS